MPDPFDELQPISRPADPHTRIGNREHAIRVAMSNANRSTGEMPTAGHPQVKSLRVKHGVTKDEAYKTLSGAFRLVSKDYAATPKASDRKQHSVSLAVLTDKLNVLGFGREQASDGMKTDTREAIRALGRRLAGLTPTPTGSGEAVP